MRPLPLLILWHIFGVMVGGMTVDWGSVMMKEHNQKITTTKAADKEDFTTTERADSSTDSTNLSGTRLLREPSVKAKKLSCFDFSRSE